MRMVDIIAKKRDGKELTTAEIDFVVQGYTQGKITDIKQRLGDGGILQRYDRQGTRRSDNVDGKFR